MDGDNTTMAQAVYLAQLFAARNTCTCEACRLLRKASEDMTAAMLGETPNRAARRRAGSKGKAAPQTELYDLPGGGARQ